MKLPLSLSTATAAAIAAIGLSLPAFARPAVLVAQDYGSRINVRSAPSTQSYSPHYGLAGDRVEIIRQGYGEDGETWFFVRFPSNATGWVRGDFVRYRGGMARYAVLGGEEDGRINVYSSPSYRSYSPHYGVPGDVVRLLDRRQGGRWVYVQFVSGAEGWVPSDVVNRMN